MKKLHLLVGCNHQLKWFKPELVKTSVWPRICAIFLAFNFFFSTQSYSQNFLNGDFENNTAGVNQINIFSNAAYNAFMANSIGFGTNCNMDIMTAPTYGVPQSGNWFVGMTGGGTDAITLELSAPLVVGNNYTISFWAKAWGSFTAMQMEIGISNVNNAYGNLLFTSPNIGVNQNWQQFTFNFVAPIAGQFITVTQTGVLGNWVNVDNFQFVNACDPSWTIPPVACSTDPPINLDPLITGDTGGTWSGTGVTGNTFDPSSGTQSVTYTAPGACDLTQTITVNTTATATWTLPTNLCDGDAPIDLTPFVTGTAGGTWSGTGITGTMFDPSVGTQSITYTAGTVPCDDAVTQIITVGTQASAAWTLPTGLCLAGAPIDLTGFITGDPGGTWSGTGITGTMFDPSGGSQSITYTVGTAPCDDVSTQTINVAPSADASWTIPTGLCIGDVPIDLSTFVTGSVGGTWSGTGITGTMFDPSVGTQNITYDVGVAPCDASVTQSITVATLANPAWVPPVNICESDPLFDLTTIVTGDPGGTWSGTGVTGNNFDPSVGTQTITYTAGTGGCQDLSTQVFTVNAAPDPSWTTLTLCVSSAPVNLDGQITGVTGGTWTGTGMSGSVFDPFFGTQSITYSVTAGGCTATSTQNITVVDPQVTILPTNVSCFGLLDGSAQANVTGGSGNYTYLWNPTAQTTQTASGLASGSYTVTVTDVDAGCSATQTATIIEPSEITLSLVGTNGCDPDKGTALVQAIGGVSGFTYAWTPSGQTSDIAINLDSAMHTVVVTDANGCTATDSVLVQILPPPTIQTIADTTIIYPNCITLPVTGGVSYSWSPTTDMDDNTSNAPEACPMYDTQYCVTGTDATGCVNSDCVLITVEIICGEVFVPSGFSPNNDGENDVLCVYSDCLETFTFTIYNRWGEKVYETQNETICWDGIWKGKELNSAVFVYVIDGYLINGQTINQKGNISLIR